MFCKISITLLTVLTFVICDPCENVTCPIIPKHYRDLGCTPIKRTSDCCPTSFNCRDFESLDKNKCHYMGQQFKLGEWAPKNIVGECEAACRCHEGDQEGDPAYFDCASIECPDLFDDSLNANGCVGLVEPGSCCPEYKCSDQDIQNLPVCIWNNQRYRVGEQIIDMAKSLPCHECFCSENFDNSTIIGNSACREINCGLELRGIQQFQRGCVPIYFERNLCCPMQYRCPDENDVVLKSKKPTRTMIHPPLQCKFGKLILNVDDEIVTNDIHTVCKCTIPPFIHCIHSYIE